MQSCRNDIDIFTDKEEQFVIYGLLDISQPVQYIKIGRTFLNPNISAKEIAQIRDSLYFEELIVKLINNQTGEEIFLNKIDSIPKDSGFFQNQVNILYATSEILDNQSVYTLSVTNPKTDLTAIGQTKIVNSPHVSFPISVGHRVMTFDPVYPPIELRCVIGSNAFNHDAHFEFWLEEFSIVDSTQKKVIHLDWKFTSNIKTQKGNPNISSVTPGLGFYEFFLENYYNGVFNNDTSMRRRIARTDFVLYSASQDLSDFVEASSVGISIIQKQTVYSNIQNGIGLFSSRHTTRISNVKLDELSLHYFNNRYYPKYKVLKIVP